MNYKLKLFILLQGLFLCMNNSAQQFDSATHAKQQAIDQGIKTTFQVLGTQANEELSYHRTKNRALNPVEDATKRNQEKSTELAEKQIKNAEANSDLLDLQIQEAKIDKLTKLHDVSEKNSSSSGKRNSEKQKIRRKRIEKQLDEYTKDLPELTEEELTEITPKKSEKTNAQPKVSILSKLSAKLSMMAEYTTQGIDAVANKTVAHITKHDTFKDTFVARHALMINRTLVVTFAALVGYGMYKFYDKYVNDEGDIYDNDADDDESDDE